MEFVRNYGAIMAEGTPVRLTSWQWITLIVIVAGAAVSTHYRIDALDDRWQTRTVNIVTEIRKDIARVEGKIPPDWFRAMVEENKQDIKDLESELTRNFIKKEELEQILKVLKDKTHAK